MIFILPLRLKILILIIFLDQHSGDNKYKYYSNASEIKGPVVSSFTMELKENIENELFEDLISEIFNVEVVYSDIIIHYDSLTSDFINNVVRKAYNKGFTSVNNQIEVMDIPIDYSPVILILNYDKVESTKSVLNVLRRYTIHFISIVNPLLFEDFMNKGLKSSDVIIFVCQKYYGTCKTAFDEGNEAIDPYLLINSRFLHKVFLTLVLEFSDNGRVRFYDVCYYCGTLAKKLTLKFEENLLPGSNVSDLYSRSNITIMVNDENGWTFNEHTFKVGFPTGEVNFKCQNQKIKFISEKETTVSCTDLALLEGNIIEEIQKRLNFNIDFVYFENNEQGAQNTLVDMVHRDQADWAVGSITITASRLNKVVFSNAVNSDPSKVVYGVETTFLKDGLNLVYVLSVNTWILVGFTLIVLSGAVYISNIKSSKKRSRSFSKIFWVVGFVLAEQAHHVDLKLFGRRLLFFWLLCSINITTLYKAKLTSFITMPPGQKLLNLDQLVDDGYSLNLIESRVIEEMLNSSTDKTLQELSRRMSFHPNRMCETLKEIIGRKEILIDEQGLLFEYLNNKCRNNKKLHAADLLRLRFTRDNIFPPSHGWAFNKGNPYLTVINNYILLFHQYGLSKKWGQYLYDPPRNHGVYFDGNTIVDKGKVTTKPFKFYGQYVLWIIGMGLSCFCFILEITVHIFQKYKKCIYNFRK